MIRIILITKYTLLLSLVLLLTGCKKNESGILYTIKMENSTAKKYPTFLDYFNVGMLRSHFNKRVDSLIKNGVLEYSYAEGYNAVYKFKTEGVLKNIPFHIAGNFHNDSLSGVRLINAHNQSMTKLDYDNIFEKLSSQLDYKYAGLKDVEITNEATTKTYVNGDRIIYLSGNDYLVAITYKNSDYYLKTFHRTIYKHSLDTYSIDYYNKHVADSIRELEKIEGL